MYWLQLDDTVLVCRVVQDFFWGQCNLCTYVYALESVSMTSKTPWNPQNCCFADVFPFPRYRSSDSSGLFSGVGRLHIVWIMSMHVCNAIQKIVNKSGHLMFLCLANLGNTISWIKLETHYSFARHFVPKNFFNRLLLDIDLYIYIDICTAGHMSEKCQVPGNLLTLGVPISIRIAVKDHSRFLHGFQKVLNVHRLEWPMREGAHLLRNSPKLGDSDASMAYYKWLWTLHGNTITMEVLWWCRTGIKGIWIQFVYTFDLPSGCQDAIIVN